MKSNIKNFGNGWQSSSWYGDDFIRNQKTYYKDFVCGSKYGNCRCRLIYQNRTFSIVLRNEYKSVVTLDLSNITIDLVITDNLTNELYQTLLTYENNIHTATS